MLRQYEVYSGYSSNQEIYTESKEKIDAGCADYDTKEIRRDVLLDVVWAPNEDEAVNTVAWAEDVDPSTLYAIQHVADTYQRPEDGSQPLQLEAGSYVDDNDFGFEILLPDQRTVRLKFENWDAFQVILENPDTGENRLMAEIECTE